MGRQALAQSVNRRVFYGWIMVFVAGFSIFASGPGQSHTFSAFNALIAADLGITNTELAFAYSLATVGAASLLPLFGRQVERFGSRRSLMGVSLALGLACLFFGAAANFLWLVAGFGLLRFFGQGSMMLGAANLVAQWFSLKRGFAMGLMALGFAASMAIHPTLARVLIEAFGWREAWIGLGVMTWVMMLPLLFLLVEDKPEDLGLRPDNTQEPEAAGGHVPALGGATLAEALHHPSFYIVATGLFMISGLVTTLHFHQYNILASQGLEAKWATLGFWFTAISMVLAMPLVGRGFDRFRTRYMFAAALCVQATTLTAVTFVTSVPTLLAYSLAFGLNNAFSMTLFGYIFPRYFGRLNLGRIQGTGQMVAVVGASVGPVPVSYALDFWGDPVMTLRLLSLLPLAAALIAVVFLRTAPQVKGYEHLE
ncbi:MFS transporter [Denitrobaculum tricleocarpae]|uniref:MFS transporter n=2 Tax=Denitrobaculum tricleocarpae TaxID=2591009 RepID=A0A545TB88_9PROT|nr:MFS transporter [Denitrobaculum tricleocarpae]